MYDVQTPTRKLPEDESVRTVAVSSYFSGNEDELDKRVMSMMEKGENMLENHAHRRAYVCKVCGKEGKGTNIKDHIEANHLEGILIPCNLCDKSLRSRNALRHHTRQHKID